MENIEIIDSADSCNSMVIEDVMKSQNNDLYCPDLSDMRDDNYEFWDFLNSKKDTSPKVEENAEDILQNKFWDFLGPSVNEVKNAALFKNCKQTEFTVASNNDTKTKPSSSDDEFWDFLSCHSPVITFEEAFRNYNPTLPDKDGENSSLFPTNEESSFVSSSEFFESGIFSSSSQSCVTSENYPQTIQKCRRNNFEMKGNTRQNFSLENNSELNERISVPCFTNDNDARNFTEQDCHIDEKDVEWLDSLSTEYKANETTEMNQKMHGNNNSSFSSVYDNLMQPNVEFQKNMYSNTDPADDTNQKRNIQKTSTSDSSSNTFKQIFLQSSTSSGCSTSSGSSANANLAWMTSVFSGTNIPDSLVENINSNTINSSDSQIQETRKFTQLINKKQCKRSRNTSNRLNVVKRTLDVTCDSASNTARKSSSNTEEIQK
ncbi:SCAN box domain-containing protein, partial [Caerostris extrusa]